MNASLSMNSPIVAAVQMVSTTNLAENLQVARSLIEEAAKQGANLVLLPEYFAIMARSNAERLEAAEGYGNGPIQDFLSATAKEYGIWLICGSLPLYAEAADRLYNALLVHDPQGNCIARYDKIHLFSFKKGKEYYNEGAVIEAGEHPEAIDTPLGRIGLSICYDLRFPELYRALGIVDLIVVPAAFVETTGQAHWEILLRARAIENQCYVLAAAQGGLHENGRQTHGNSMLIDPWGTIVERRHKGPGIVVGELCHEKIAEVRQDLPALKHRVLKTINQM